RYQSHHTSASRIHRHRIVPQHQNSSGLQFTLNGAVAFHSHNTVHDRKIRPDGRINVKNRPINAGPVEYILGPSVASSRHGPKHILQRKGDASPMMRLELWHRDYVIGAEKNFW